MKKVILIIVILHLTCEIFSQNNPLAGKLFYKIKSSEDTISDEPNIYVKYFTDSLAFEYILCAGECGDDIKYFSPISYDADKPENTVLNFMYDDEISKPRKSNGKKYIYKVDPISKICYIKIIRNDSVTAIEDSLSFDYFMYKKTLFAINTENFRYDQATRKHNYMKSVNGKFFGVSAFKTMRFKQRRKH